MVQVCRQIVFPTGQGSEQERKREKWNRAVVASSVLSLT